MSVAQPLRPSVMISLNSKVMFFTQVVLLSLLWLHLAESSPLATRPLAREVQVNNDLALNMLQSLSTEDNTFFSPLSLSTALLTLLNGADGETDKELRQALEIKADEDLQIINSGMKRLLESLEDKNSKDLTLKLLTQLLVAKNKKPSEETLKAPFVKIIKEDYKSEVKEVDFENNSKEVTKDLNEWIREKTNNRIQRLFRNNLDGSSSMVLANAVYFTGKWRRPFTQTTEKRNFNNFMSYQMPGLATSIPFMSLEDKLRSKSTPELKSTLLELPYSHNLSMIVVLPDAQEDLQFLNENMTSVQLNSAIEDLMSVNPESVRLLMPKFKLDSDYDLKEPLEDIFEIKTLFNNPDFSKAMNSAQKVSQAVHRASIDVNEEGTEAAAATGVELQYLSLPPEIVIDRPFIFLIRDSNNGLIVFMGRVHTLIDEQLLGLGFI